MARITFGPTVTALKGSIGGTTFQTNAAGAFARARPYVKKTSTVKQQLAHQSHQNLLFQYSQLDATDKDDWNMFASAHDKINKFGQTKTLTGANWFLSTNFMRLLSGNSILTSPPDYNLPSDAPAFDINITADAITLTLDAEFGWSDMAVIVWCSPPTSRQKPSINQIRKYVTIYTSDPGTPVDITSLWETATGISWTPIDTFPSANIFICLEVVCISSGISSPLLCASVNTVDIEGFDPDAQAYFDACPTPLSPTNQGYVNTFIVQLKADGNWDGIIRMGWHANEYQADAVIDMRFPAATACTEHGGYTWTQYVGYQGNGTSAYILPEYNGSSDTPAISQNSFTMGMYIMTNISEVAWDGGVMDAGIKQIAMISRLANLFIGTANSAAAENVTNLDSRGFFMVQRTASNAEALYKNGSSVQTTANASDGVANAKIALLARGQVSGPDNWSTKTEAFYILADSTINPGTFYTALQAFATSVGFNV